jgi:hypothetical protein
MLFHQCCGGIQGGKRIYVNVKVFAAEYPENAVFIGIIALTTEHYLE